MTARRRRSAATAKRRDRLDAVSIAAKPFRSAASSVIYRERLRRLKKILETASRLTRFRTWLLQSQRVSHFARPYSPFNSFSTFVFTLLLISRLPYAVKGPRRTEPVVVKDSKRLRALLLLVWPFFLSSFRWTLCSMTGIEAPVSCC
jgi:hypothetical protein